MTIDTYLSVFVRETRKKKKMSQKSLAIKAGVGLLFVRQLETGRTSMPMDKVNRVLNCFGYALGPISYETYYRHAQRQKAFDENLISTEK